MVLVAVRELTVKGRVSSEMEKSVEDEVDYRACAECTRVCLTTHGEGLLRSVPRFSRPVPEYALPSAKDCNMQIPAIFVRNHIPNAKGKYILVGVTGAEWVVARNAIAFTEGWKAFATDYKLEKGDQVMFALVGPKRLYVDVFDKFGMEKFSTKEPVNSRASPSTVINKGDPRIESPVSNFAGISQHPPPSVLKTDGMYALRFGKASGENDSNDEKPSPLSRKRGLTDRDQSSQEPVKAEPSSSSQSSIASDDSVQVQLAKSVLRKAKQKKLKKRRMSCTSSHPVAAVAVAEAARIEGAFEAEEPELCKNLQNEGGVIEAKSIEDKVSKGVAILRSYVDPTGGFRGNDDEIMVEKRCEDPIVGESKDGGVTPDVGHEHQDLAIGVPDQLEEPAGEKISRSDGTQDEALDGIGSGRGAPGDDPAVKGSESVLVASPQPIQVFQPGLVKQEPDIGVARSYPYKKCENCGLCKTKFNPCQLRPLKPEPVMSERLGNPEIRSPSSIAPNSSSLRATEDQKRRALIAAKDMSGRTINRHATVVMRVSFNEKTFDCFVSLKCAEMLPSGATELTLLDCEGVSCKANWNGDRRFLHGPGWRDFVDSHNLQLDDVFVLEVRDNSEQEFVVLVHIFRAHEMEFLPLHPSPAVTGYVQACPATANAQATPTGPNSPSSNLLHGHSPLSKNRKTKASKFDEAVQVELPTAPAFPRAAMRELPERSNSRNWRRTSSSSLSTPGGASAAVLTPFSLSERMKPVVQTEPPGQLPVASTANSARADAELPISSLMTRTRRASSSPLKPATGSLASVPTSGTDNMPLRDLVDQSLAEAVKSEQAKYKGWAKKKAVRERASLYAPHERKKDEAKASRATPQQQQRTRDGSSEKQVRTENSRKVRYPVTEILDRRKSVQGDVLFLVELGKPMNQSGVHSKMKAKPIENWRRWVPHHQLTKDFSSCFL